MVAKFCSLHELDQGEIELVLIEGGGRNEVPKIYVNLSFFSLR